MPSAGGDYEQELVRILTAVAYLHAFLQANLTAPDRDAHPLSLLNIPVEKQPSIIEEILVILQLKAITELAYAGELAYHLTTKTFLFHLAQILRLLNLPYYYARSEEWWRMRAWNIHAQLIGELVAFPGVPLEDLEQTFAE